MGLKSKARAFMKTGLFNPGRDMTCLNVSAHLLLPAIGRRKRHRVHFIVLPFN